MEVLVLISYGSQIGKAQCYDIMQTKILEKG